MIILGVIILFIIGVIVYKEGINESISMNDPDDNEVTEDET